MLELNGIVYVKYEEVKDRLEAKDNELIEFAIEKLTELMIKQDFEDRKKGSHTYVRKTRCYKDLINLLKEVKEY